MSLIRECRLYGKCRCTDDLLLTRRGAAVACMPAQRLSSSEAIYMPHMVWTNTYSLCTNKAKALTTNKFMLQNPKEARYLILQIAILSEVSHFLKSFIYYFAGRTRCVLDFISFRTKCSSTHSIYGVVRISKLRRLWHVLVDSCPACEQ